jgi:adenylylsulfate kinase
MAAYWNRVLREMSMKKKGFTIWFTGLPFSGKKQLAAMLAAKLDSLGLKTKILDGGQIRREFDSQLGYSRKDVYKSIHRICFECRMLTESGVVAIAVTISPYDELREECREQIGEFIEIYCKAPINILRKRDTKTFYQRADKGEIKDVAGISSPFEEPGKPDVIFECDHESYDIGLDKILVTLQKMGYINKLDHRVLTEQEEKDIRERLKDMNNS